MENAGQFDPAVRFQVRTSQEILWLTDHSLWLSALEPKPEISRDEPLDRPAGPNAGGSVATPHGVNLHLTFPGSRPGASLVAARPLPTRVNYFLGSDRSRWQSGVRTYRAVTWRGLYPGISVTLSGVQGAPALTVRAGPGTDPAAFRLRVAGARDLRASPEGRLVADTGVGPLTLPAILHDGRGLGSAVHGTVVSFTGSPGSPPARRPAGNVNASGGKGLEYGTFLGGSDDDYAADLAVGQDRSTYVTGWTYSSNFPTTPGAFDTIFNGGRDVFISQLDPTGSALVFSTFLGGGGWDTGLSLTLGPDGSAYVGGYTVSEDFPTTPGAYDTTSVSGDAFLTELNPDGDALVYSTFLGGDHSSEILNALALAGDGTLYATGQTFSDDFPTTPGAFDSTYHGDGDGFVTALNPQGSDLVYSTFLGGSLDDHGYGIALGPDGTAYVTGMTSSDDFPTTQGAFDRTRNGANDVFVTRLTADGSALAYSTYIGGNDDDTATAIGLDQAGNAYVIGHTISRNYPTTPGAYDTTFNGTCICDDAFGTKLDPTGSALRYSTFLGGKDLDGAQDLAVDPDGSLNVTGTTESRDFPTTGQAYDRTMGGSGDLFVSRFDPTGSHLAYSSYLGGTNLVYEQGGFVAPASPGAVSVAGYTQSADFPTTAGAYDRTYNGGFDAFVATLRVAPTMHVGGIDPGYRPALPGYDVGARILIVRSDGSPVGGASVSVELDYPGGSKVMLTGKTGPTGVAVMGHHVMNTGTYTFTVLGVLGPPAVYDPSQNVETSDSITIP